MGLGHEVHLLSQDRHPERQPFVDAVGDWDGGDAAACARCGRARARAARRAAPSTGPTSAALLPVYVADRYEGIEARTFAECSDAEIARYLDANVAAVRERRSRCARPQVALANHLVMGPVILARALAGDGALRGQGPRQRAGVHGQARPRALPGARARGARAAPRRCSSARATPPLSLWEALGDPELPRSARASARPGVDVARFAPREPRGAPRRALRALAAQLRWRATAAGQPSERRRARSRAIAQRGRRGARAPRPRARSRWWRSSAS